MLVYGEEEAADELQALVESLGRARSARPVTSSSTASFRNGTSSIRTGGMDVEGKLRALGFSEPDVCTLADHFRDAEERGKTGHGFSRVTWLETLPDLDPSARPERLVAEEGYERWDGGGAIGYLTLAAICDAQLRSPPKHARLIAAQKTFPTGMLGYWVRRWRRAASSPR